MRTNKAVQILDMIHPGCTVLDKNTGIFSCCSVDIYTFCKLEVIFQAAIFLQRSSQFHLINVWVLMTKCFRWHSTFVSFLDYKIHKSC